MIGLLLRSSHTFPTYSPGLNAGNTPRPSCPSQKPTLNGMPTGVFSIETGTPTRAADPHDNFCVEKTFKPMCARMLGREAGKPKQSGSMYSALVLPNSLRKYCVP